MTVVVVSGGFDPLHSGHIALLKAARELGTDLVVGVNSDEWLVRKKGRPFMPFSERVNIISNLEMVSQAMAFDDSDGSACNIIAKALELYPDEFVIFANGGDRNEGNIPEMDKYNDHSRVSFIFGVGGEDKANSSSWILSEWKSPKTERPWGFYRNLHQDGPGTRVKEISVTPGKHLSMQKHRYRSEYWMCTYGQATVYISDKNPDSPKRVTLKPHDEIHIPVGTWHQLANETTQEVRIVEIQYGENCMEEDIERIDVEEGYGVSLYDR